MLDKPIDDLAGKNVALVAMGQSQIDYHLSQVHSVLFDEVWAVNAMIGVHRPYFIKQYTMDL